MNDNSPVILHVIDTTGPGGAETVFLNLAEHMDIEGYGKLALIKGPGWVQEQLEKRGIPYIMVKPHGFLSIPYYIELYRILRAYNLKYVQAHLLGSALTFSILSFFLRVPVVATLHGQVDMSPDERLVGMKRWLLKKGLYKVVAVSGQLASYFGQRKLFSRSQLEVVHNGIDVDRYGVADSYRLRDKLGLDRNSKLIGSVGNIREAKDYPNLIRAAKLVVQQYPSAHFLIAGHSKKPLQDELDNLVKQLGISENVHFLGFQEDTPEFLAQLDVFALSSKSEGFSIATLEAMAAKVPVIATECGGPEEIISNEVDGILVPPADAEALASAILRAFEPDSQMQVEAFRKVTEKFSQRSLVDSYCNIACSAIGR